MYVKVHKKGNQWFRNDNGALVGTEIPENTSYYQKLIKQIGKPAIIIKNTNNEIKIIYYGYFYNNKFTRFRDSEKSSDKNCDYYAFVPG